MKRINILATLSIITFISGFFIEQKIHSVNYHRRRIYYDDGYYGRPVGRKVVRRYYDGPNVEGALGGAATGALIGGIAGGGRGAGIGAGVGAGLGLLSSPGYTTEEIIYED